MPWSPISEARETPWAARQIRLMCPHCKGFAFADIPWNSTAEKRQIIVRKSIEEHRGICTGADATEGRVFKIEYPRA